MRFLPAALLFTGMMLSTRSTGQLAFEGQPYGTVRSNGLPVAPVAVMPPVDVAALELEDEARAASGIKGPYRFGYNHAVDLGLDNSGIWHTMSNGDRVWRVGVECPGAYSINFEFHQFGIPEGAQVFAYNEQGHVSGAFEAGSNPGHDQLGVDLIPGDRITIEYVEPARVAGRGRLRIGQVTHGYRDVLGFAKGFNESGSCNNNVICPEGDAWRSQIRSVAMMITQGSGFCTGQLINNCANDGTPYFLTANHCIEGTNSNFIFRFNWNSPVCSPNTNGPMNQSVSGSTLLENSAGSDVALLRLNTPPPASYNVYFTGWDKSSSAASGGVTAIHHPSGDIKKISFETAAVSTSSFGGAQCWRVNDWDDGTTEGGSSGSGLWNQSGLLVGQLFGGGAACDNNFSDYYGKFSVSYPVLSQWLGDCGNTLQGYPSVSAGMDEPVLDGALDLWPNPTTGDLVLLLPAYDRNTPFTVRAFDGTGRVVFETLVPAGTERFELDLQGQRAGLYLVEARSETVRLQQRVVLTY